MNFQHLSNAQNSQNMAYNTVQGILLALIYVAMVT